MPFTLRNADRDTPWRRAIEPRVSPAPVFSAHEAACCGAILASPCEREQMCNAVPEGYIIATFLCGRINVRLRLMRYK